MSLAWLRCSNGDPLRSLSQTLPSAASPNQATSFMGARRTDTPQQRSGGVCLGHFSHVRPTCTCFLEGNAVAGRFLAFLLRVLRLVISAYNALESSEMDH